MIRTFQIWAGLIIFAFLISCKFTSDNPTNSRFGSPDYSTINKENRSRDAWQKPSQVIDMLGDISDLTIADIGAGTGYFTFRLALNAKKVIAVEIDPNMIDLIDAFKINLPNDLNDKIETRLATPSDSRLNEGEADVVVIINTISYIKDKTNYLKHLYSLLPIGGKLLLVDYKNTSLPINIDQGDYISSSKELKETLELIGFTNSSIDNSSLEYQYIMIAEKP